VLVECPRCGGCAVHRQLEPQERPTWFAPRRLVCPGCAFTRDWADQTITRHTQQRTGLDEYFELPLWIREECRHGVVWAYNAPHLDALEAFVKAKLRERSPDPQWGWSNRSWASRLPGWMKDRKHRDEILEVIGRLRERIPERFR
jgi:hypothetical protein